MMLLNSFQCRHAIALLLIFLFVAPNFIAARAADSAVVLMYHRFGEMKHPTTNITIKQFEAHIAELSSGEYTVIALPEIIATLRARRPLPNKTVGISIDDAFLSVYEIAWPRLRTANFPFTLFIATNPVDNRNSGYMSWDQIRELANYGVTIGSQTTTHPHMPMMSEAHNVSELKSSNARFEAELGITPTLIAYPYGEYSLAVGRITKNAGFFAGFGQHSGVIHRNSNFFYLPRFSFNEVYGDVDRLQIAARALPIVVTDFTPADPLVLNISNPPLIGFTIDNITSRRLNRLACYVSNQGKAKIERLGNRRIEVRMKQPFGIGRTRINCTLPEKGKRWRWLGRQFVVPPR